MYYDGFENLYMTNCFVAGVIAIGIGSLLSFCCNCVIRLAWPDANLLEDHGIQLGLKSFTDNWNSLISRL